MAQDFRSFLNSLAGANALPDPRFNQVVPSTLPPVQGPMPIAPPPVQQQAPSRPMPQSPIMDPRTFALFQQQQQMPQQVPPPVPQRPVQGPPPPVPQIRSFQQQEPPVTPEEPPIDYGGTWVFVDWSGPEGTVSILMPEANAVSLPDGAHIRKNGTFVNEPEKIKQAEEGGFLLQQMPPETQDVFRSRTDQADVDQTNPAIRAANVQENIQAIEDTGFGPPNLPTQVPTTDPAGRTPDQVFSGQADFDELQKEIQRLPPDQVVANEQIRSRNLPLTTDAIRARDEPDMQVKAGRLERAKIFEIPVDQMVVEDAQGGLRLAPVSDTPPPNTTIFIYGGLTTNPSEDIGENLLGGKEIGHPIEWLGGFLQEGPGALIERPQRELQGLVSGIFQGELNPVGRSIVDTWNKLDDAAEVIPGMGWLHGMRDTVFGKWAEEQPGFNAFAYWMVQNPEIVNEVRQNGYVAEDGQVFTGERAVWERFEQDRNWLQRMGDTATTDPFNLLPTMGAPIRAVGRGIGRAAIRAGADDVAAPIIRRGVGPVDEVVDIAARTPAQLADDFARAPTVAETPPVIRRGVGPTDESIQPSQVVPESSRPIATTATQQVLYTTEDILNAAANVLDVPENVLGAIVDRGLITSRALGRWLASNSDFIDNTFNAERTTARRNNVEPVRDKLYDVKGREIIPQEVIPSDAIPPISRDIPPDDPRAIREGVESAAEVPPSAVTNAGTPSITPSQPPLTAVTRQPGEAVLPVAPPIEQAQPSVGAAGQPVSERPAEPLSIDRPVDDLGRQSLVSEQEFQGTSLGEETARRVQTWPEYIRPQTVDARSVGEGRVGSGFSMRPVDAARSLASSAPDKWRAFMRDFDKALHRESGYINLEQARQQVGRNGKPDIWKHFESDRFPNQREDGRALRRTWEMLIEADSVARNEYRLFKDNFKGIADAPPYAWKRWNYGGQEHTAMDTLNQNGGQYVEGMDLAEATEVAIFHSDDDVARAALNDIVDRLSVRDDLGRTEFTQNNHNRLHPKIKSDPKAKVLSDILSNSQKSRFSIRRLREAYQENTKGMLEGGEELGRLNVDDIGSLSRQINEPAITEPAPETGIPQVASRDTGTFDSIGAEQFERDLNPDEAAIFDQDVAASALRDVGEVAQERPIGVLPESLPLRDTEPIPLGGTGSSGVVARESDVATAIRQKVKGRQTDLETRARAEPSTFRDRMAGDVTAPTRRGRLAEQRAARQEETYHFSDRGPGTRMSQDELNSYYVRGRTPSAVEMQQLGRQFKDGETIIKRWDRLTSERLDQMEKAGTTLDDVAVREAENLAAEQTLADLSVEFLNAKERDFYRKELGRLARKTNENDAPLNQLEKQVRALESVDRGITRGGRAWNTFMTAVRQMFLYNVLTGPRYIQTQITGNTVSAALTGHADIIPEVLSVQSMRRALNTTMQNGNPPPSYLSEKLGEYGAAGKRKRVSGGASVRDQTIGGDEMVISKIPIIGPLTGPAANRHVRDFAAQMDVTPREVLHVNMVDSSMLSARNVLRDRMRATLPQGMTPQQFDELFDALPQRFGSDDIRAFGVDQKWADRHGRDWQEAFGKADNAAFDEVKRVYFMGDQTNADAWLKNVFFFHYWMSRAMPLYSGAIMRNPVYLLNFAKMVDEIRNDDDLSGTKFAKVMTSSWGYNILANPIALLATFVDVIDDDGFTPEGESILGQLIRKSPVMVNPMVQMVANMAGFMGDGFAPDPVGFNKWIGLYQAGYDRINSELGRGQRPLGNFQNQGLVILRDWVSDKAAFLPGARHIEASDQMSYKNTEVRGLVADIALERGLDLDSPIVQTSMLDPESELYQAAMIRYSSQDVADIALRILPGTAVLYPKAQLASPKERTLALSQERALAEQQGVSVTPRGEQLYTERDTIATVDEYSATMQQQQDEYQALGTDEERGAWKFYTNIQYGSTTVPVTITGQTYHPDQLAALDDASREILADTWATESGNAERVAAVTDARTAYREAHPEYAAYTAWTSQTRDFEGGPVGWWEAATSPTQNAPDGGNPNAARWYNGLDEEKKQDPLALTSLDAYMAYKGEQLFSYDNTPIETRSPIDPEPYNPSLTSGGEGESGYTNHPTGPTKKAIIEDVQEYQAALEEYNYAVSQMLGGDQQININWVNPMAREAIISNMRDLGIEYPRMSQYLYDYMEWAKVQTGSTAIETYLAWYKRQNPETPETTTTLPVTPP